MEKENSITLIMKSIFIQGAEPMEWTYKSYMDTLNSYPRAQSD
jgi:hypothetical protein